MPIFIEQNIHKYDVPNIEYALKNLLTIENSCQCNKTYCLLCKTTYTNNIYRMIYYTRQINEKYHVQVICHLAQYITQYPNYMRPNRRLLNSIIDEIFHQYSVNRDTMDQELKDIITNEILPMLKYYTVNYSASTFIMEK